jgi:hypothetical protein
MSFKQRWFVVFLFALAMAWVEAAVVVDLRTLINRIEPYQPNPLPLGSNLVSLGQIELVRELATLVMLYTVGWLAGTTRRSRWGFTALAFGVWDIFYYVWLKVMIDWPHSLLDWDILFLLPLPWWGPVLAPVLIASLMLIGGTLVARGHTPRTWSWRISLIGATLALYTFMADAMVVAHQGVEVIRSVLPASFNWLLFSVAWALLAVPVVDVLWQAWVRREVGQIANLSTGQIANLSTGQTANLSTGQIANLSTGQTANLSTGQTANLSTGQIANLPYTQENA